MALRLGIFGVLAIVIFCALFFRLWALQVISGERICPTRRTTRSAASASRRSAARSSTATETCWSRTCRGRSSRSGPPRSRTSPTGEREAMLRRLSRVLGLTSEGRERPRSQKQLANDPADAGDHRAPTSATAGTAFLLEHQTEFPGRPDHGDVPAPLRARERSPRRSSATNRRDHGRAARGEAHGQHATRPATASARPASRPPTTRTFAASPRSRARLRRRARARDERARSSARCRRPATASDSRSTTSCSGRPRRPSTSACGSRTTTASGPRTAARSWPWT